MALREPKPHRPWAWLGAVFVAFGLLFMASTGPCTAIFGLWYLVAAMAALVSGGKSFDYQISPIFALWALIAAVGFGLFRFGVYLREKERPP
jgi:ABC-type glucose/galactose transport system permease subunit